MKNYGHLTVNVFITQATVLLLLYAKKKIKISHMDGGQLKNVCLLSVCLLSVCLLSVCLLSVCHEFVPNHLLGPWSDWAKIFVYKN